MSILINQIKQQSLPEVLRSINSAVYGVVLNDQKSVAAMQSQFSSPPYKASPIAPVLYIKPKNTFAQNNAQITLPGDESGVEVAASLALVIGQKTTAVSADQALARIAGVALVADLSLPHASYYRPAIRQKCFDGALPIADSLINIDDAAAISQLCLDTYINNELVKSHRLDNLVRSAEQLLADVSAYMSLRPGDLLLLGISYQAPLAKLGDKVKVSIAGQAEVSFTINSGAQQ
ncbi:MAG: fumarylacetoacetate hydrolase family protein [Pseudomonadales bacterium]|nr:fumarylacetoacetate hydrolase family protein [Pseudomonadales bacterium]NRA14150.1 fumarylacetoacetate hydrolase family protein [Oceanospirillaceae bacterium]